MIAGGDTSKVRRLFPGDFCPLSVHDIDIIFRGDVVPLARYGTTRERDEPSLRYVHLGERRATAGTAPYRGTRRTSKQWSVGMASRQVFRRDTGLGFEAGPWDDDLDERSNETPKLISPSVEPRGDGARSPLGRRMGPKHGVRTGEHGPRHAAQRDRSAEQRNCRAAAGSSGRRPAAQAITSRV